MKAANLVTQTLADLGVRCLAGVIGSSIEDIVETVPAHRTLRYLSVRHEQVASGLCDGYAKVSGKPMACIAHAGPGACNLLTGVASAFRDSTPMIVLTGNLGSSRLGRDAWHELDVEAIYRPVTKWTARIRRPAEIESVLRCAYHCAVDGRPGPVLVDIPQDMSAAQLPEDAVESAPEPLYRNITLPDDHAVAQAARSIQAAKRPVIFAGGGVFWSRGWEALGQLAREFSIPVATTETARGVLPEDDPLCLGMMGLFGNPAANRAVKDADLVLGIGCRFSETSTFGWTLIPSRTPIVQVNADIREIGRQFPVTIGIAADAHAFLERLLGQLRASGSAPAHKTERDAWLKELQALRASERASFFERATDAVPIKPQTIIRELIEVAGRDAIYSVGQGNLTSFCTRAPIHRPGSYLQSAGLGTLGYAFPAALGAQLASPGRRVFCLVGDGDFGSVMQDLDTAVRESLGVITLVFNNGGYGVNRLNQLSRGVKPFGVDFINPDFAALARMYGMQGIRVEKLQDLRAALKEAVGAPGPALLDIPIDPAERVGANPKAVGLYT